MTRDGRMVLSVTEAAGLLGISRGLAYELVARGELPSLRLGRPPASTFSVGTAAPPTVAPTTPPAP